MRRIAILGSTGSVGVTTLDVVSRFPERFEVVALAAGRNAARLREQMGHAGYSRVEPDFCDRNMVRRIEAVYEGCLRYDWRRASVDEGELVRHQ